MYLSKFTKVNIRGNTDDESNNNPNLSLGTRGNYGSSNQRVSLNLKYTESISD
ncbi:hypothetical protein cce_4155 [Crocosphaera subtropica ATCC 51142]|uniref:Uncharacterized protein n=1 Tax=Crocosphaera subtropica (strain ATCC 51142 / BH68) TaxID=43989 RepID=B1WRR2_CROS5|nr:hypothetical protein cce_4155 [Crocosphaera subtropica ATCC 51142]